MRVSACLFGHREDRHQWSDSRNDEGQAAASTEFRQRAPRSRNAAHDPPYAPQRRRDFLPPFFFARRSPLLPATSPV